VHIPFGPATPSQARTLFLHFYPLEDLGTTDRSTTPTKEKLSRGPVTQADLETLADAFVEAVFSSPPSAEEGEIEKSGDTSQPVNISMAALQAYLLKFKEEPQAAVENAAEWAKHAEPDFAQLSSSALAPPPPTPTAPRTTETKIQNAPLRKKVLKKTVKTLPEDIVGTSDSSAPTPAPSSPSVAHSETSHVE
jgi:chaperone BCS1